MLGDLLKETLNRNPQPTNDMIHTQFIHFQEERKPRAQLFVDGSHWLQRLEALENPFLKFMALNIISKQELDQMAPILASMYSPRHILKYLPRPSREGVVARDCDVVANPRQLSFVSSSNMHPLQSPDGSFLSHTLLYQS